MKSYTLIEEKELSGINSYGYVYKHNKSGARIFYLANPEDSNKVFSVSFCTPPEDDMGIPHILEHSVLCGSDRYPLKDPFIQLAKGSLNTFLNAMTYPDKTMYPIASTNDTDFKNLMRVYLDAVFYPNIRKDPRLLMQEGWHYEINEELSELSVSGVVYNEMKGAFSSSEEVLNREIKKLLFPDTPYQYESGGHPDAIPELTYERYLDFYQRHYAPSNSYIFLYGDGNKEELLQLIDEEYLSHFEDAKYNWQIPDQHPFEETHEESGVYALPENEDPQGKAYLSFSTAVDLKKDPIRYYAMDLLEYMLLETESSPLKNALMERGLGEDIYGIYDNSLHQPIFSIVAKNADASRKEEFLEVIRTTLERLCEEGLDPDLVLGALNRYEFRLKEGEYGSTPTGLIYDITCMDSWLYGDSPMMLLNFSECYEKIRASVKDGYFEQLIRETILENPHALIYTLLPDSGLSNRKDQEFKEALSEILDGMDEAARKEVKAAGEALKAFQEAPETEEALNSVPILKLSDIKEAVDPVYYDVTEVQGRTLITYEGSTHGITYLKWLFPLDHLNGQELSKASLLCDILGAMDTTRHSYSQLTNAVNLHTGGIGMSIDISSPEQGDSVPYFKIIGKCFNADTKIMQDLVLEQILDTVWEDLDHFKKLVLESRSRFELGLSGSGHRAAVNRAMAAFYDSAALKEYTSGMDFYQLLKDVTALDENGLQAFVQELQEVCRKIFVSNELLMHRTIEASQKAESEALLKEFTEQLPCREDTRAARFVVPLIHENTGITSSGTVQFVAEVGRFTRPIQGSMSVMRSILSLDYLWNRIRVLGGAYGCMTGIIRRGVFYIVSYRDPNLTETLKNYEEAYEAISGFECSERELTKYIIGTINDLDTPMSTAMRGAQTLSMYLNKVTNETRQKNRTEVLNTTLEQIRENAQLIQEAFSDPVICVYGNEDRIKAHQDLFDTLITAI